MPKTVLLTGITGFIAKRIAYDLLKAGHSVVGSVRAPGREDEVRAAVTPEGDADAAERLRFVTLDLNADAGWAEAMAGIDVLMHTASPFPLSNPKDESEIIRPAVDGTMRALKAAQETGVRRVILTSSVVAIMHVDRPEGHLYGPEDWTDIGHPTASAYIKSKTLAERAAWDFVQEAPIDLTTIHPGLVLGAPRDGKYGSSLEVVERILGGKDPALPELGFPVVDVADVSHLHVAAMERPETIGKRIIAAGEWATMPALARILKEVYPDRKIATRVAPKLLMRVLALFDAEIRTVLPQVGRRTPMDNAETREIFGIDFIPTRDALLASARAILAQA